MKVIIIAFNFEFVNGVANGPGESLKNFYNIIKSFFEVEVYTELKSTELFVNNIKKLNIKKIKKEDCIIYWSGLTIPLFDIIKKITLVNDNIIIGPNLIDTVEVTKEKYLFSFLKFKKLLTLNERLKHLIANTHNISLSKIKLLCVGPDINIWNPSDIKDDTILWKGNSKHFVKDVSFALSLQNSLPQYKFKFIGYPNTYKYKEHIEEAKKSKIYISTSLSETMGLTLIESWASGLPSVTHPLIYLHGENYKTGIITNKTINDYSQAIIEIMSNNILYKEMSEYAIAYAKINFGKDKITRDFMEIINVC
jgi:glycosyltransferase involved in cell wall biosynthesis